MLQEFSLLNHIFYEKISDKLHLLTSAIQAFTPITCHDVSQNQTPSLHISIARWNFHSALSHKILLHKTDSRVDASPNDTIFIYPPYPHTPQFLFLHSNLMPHPVNLCLNWLLGHVLVNIQ